MNFALQKASSEQLSIVKSLNDNNVVVDSCAGAGKTTTVLHIAKCYENDNILLMTYNAKLKLETRQKIEKLGLKNIETHSYHSFCVKYYDRSCFTDKPIREMIDDERRPLSKYKYSIIILDEAQDITPLYYTLICKIFSDNKHITKFCILGDEFQSIYGFNKADPRFLTFSERIYNFGNYNWINKKLSITYRMNDETVKFVNKCMLNSDRIKSNKSGWKPRYIICDCFNDAHHERYKPYQEIRYYISLGYQNHEIFVLAPSVKSERSPVRILANTLSRENIPIFVPHNDEEKLDSQVLENKIVFATYHQTKGLERKVVIVFNFDASYFKYYKKNVNPLYCPNELYVAVTRSIERLTLLHHDTNDYLQFIEREYLEETCNCQFSNIYEYSSNKKNQITNLPVTDLTRHLSEDVIEKAATYFGTDIINKKGEYINIPIKTKQGNLYENVSDINGTAIPAYFDLKKNNKMKISDCIIKKKPKNNYMFLKDDDDSSSDEDSFTFSDNIDIKIDTITPSELLYIANKWNSDVSGYIYKLKQIKNYDWLSKQNLEKAYNRLKKYISEKSTFEIILHIDNQPELVDKKLIGVIDCIDGNRVWEFKCVKELENVHQIQLAIYMYMMLIQNDTCEYNFYLFNILNENIIEIKSDLLRLKSMIKYLIHEKYFSGKTQNDINFIMNIRKIREKYV